MDQPSLDVALAELRRLVEVGLVEIRGQLALVIQRLDHVDLRHAELVRRVDADRALIEELGDRLQIIERDAVTRPQLADRTRQIIAVVSLLVTIAGVAVTLVLGLIT